MNNEKKNVPDVWGAGRKLPDNWGKSNIDGSSGSPWSANKKTLPTQGNLKSPVWGNSENANNADSIPDKNKTTISQNSLNESVQSVDSENRKGNLYEDDISENFDYEQLRKRSQRRSKLIRGAVFGIAGIIVVLFAAKVIMMKVSLIKESDNSGNRNNDVIVESTPDTDFVETTLVDSKATEKAETIQTTVFTDKINKKTESTIAEDEYSSDEISSMFTEFLSANADPNRGYEYYSNSELKYALIDLNNDDRQELVVSNGENEDGLTYVESIYSINNGKLSMIWAGDIRFCDWLCEGNYICSHYSLNEGNGFSIYRISSNEALEEIDDVGINYESGSRRILYNGVEISETEYNSISEKYKAVYFETKPLQLTAFSTSSTLIDAAKKAIYAHLDEKFYDEKTKQWFFDREAKYAMYDIDNNGVDELFITYYVDSGDVISDLYVYENGEYLKKYSFNEAKICLSDDLILQNIYGGGIGTWIYTLVNGEVLQKDEFKDMPDAYYHNDLVVSEYEYNSIYSEYEKKDWIYLTHSSKYISELIDMSAYTDTSAKYTTYDTSAAGSDFSFISQPYSAKVITERDPLNLRAAPSSTGEVIIKMPKGSMVNLWGTDGEWDYLSYTENGITYYGYASSDYIGFT